MSSRERRCSWSSADRRCSNYIWVIDNFIAFLGASYIRDFTLPIEHPVTENVVATIFLAPLWLFPLNTDENPYGTFLYEMLIRAISDHEIPFKISATAFMTGVRELISPKECGNKFDSEISEHHFWLDLTLYGSRSCAHFAKLPSGECQRSPLMINEYWFRWWLGAIRSQVITWSGPIMAPIYITMSGH